MTEPTKAALACADAIVWRDCYYVPHVKTTGIPLAKIIDRHFPGYEDLLAVVEELIESAAYWSEYDVPLGIVDRMKAAVKKARGTDG